jgi:hypothetical protein
MRWAAFTVSLVLAVSVSWSASAAPGQEAYQAAMKCYVANVHAANGRKKVGDTAKAAIYVTNAKRSFDGAVALGRNMGLSNQQMNSDLDDVEARELGRIVADQDYFRSTVATCKGMGLM